MEAAPGGARGALQPRMHARSLGTAGSLVVPGMVRHACLLLLDRPERVLELARGDS